MALVDVTQILADPDFADDFVVTRSNRSVSSTGRTVDTPATYYTYGVVQPAKEVQLKQIPDLERVGSYISIVTPFLLFALTPITAPDQVTWNLKNYRVKIVRDWSNYGSGFVEAICEESDLTMNGPQYIP